MSDYCTCKSDTCDRTTVQLKFLHSELLYDIKNYAYVEADIMGEDNQHAQHVTADIGEDGNIDRVDRILSVVHAAVIEMLYPYTKQIPIEETIDDKLVSPEEYIVELSIPTTMSRTTIQLLSRLIHEFMVYRVLADWLSMTNPQAALNWAGKAEECKDAIKGNLNSRRERVRRPLTPFA